MKQKLLIAAGALALVLCASTAEAQGLRVQVVEVNANASATPEQVETRAGAKTQVEARRASSTEARVEMQASVAKRKATHTASVFSATIGRLEKIADRIESRIAKFEAEGGLVANAKIHLNEARVHLSEAEASVKVFVSLDLGGETFRENFEKIRATAVEVKKHIRAAHTSLMMTVRSLKASAEAGAEVGASTTTSN